MKSDCQKKNALTVPFMPFFDLVDELSAFENVPVHFVPPCQDRKFRAGEMGNGAKIQAVYTQSNHVKQHQQGDSLWIWLDAKGKRCVEAVHIKALNFANDLDKGEDRSLTIMHLYWESQLAS